MNRTKSELETQTAISADLGYLYEHGAEEIFDHLDRIFSLVGGLIASLKRQDAARFAQPSSISE